MAAAFRAPPSAFEFDAAHGALKTVTPEPETPPVLAALRLRPAWLLALAAGGLLASAAWREPLAKGMSPRVDALADLARVRRDEALFRAEKTAERLRLLASRGAPRASNP